MEPKPDIPKWLEKLKDDPLYIAKAGRKTYKINLLADGDYGHPREEATIEQGANCYSSESRLVPDMHLPCFDVDLRRDAPAPQMGLLTVEDVVVRQLRLLVGSLDIEIRWVPSSTPGNHHVYVDYAVEWERYLSMLAHLTDAKIVERGYYEASQAGGATFVRLPGVKRETPRFSAPPSVMAGYWALFDIKPSPTKLPRGISTYGSHLIRTNKGLFVSEY